MIEKKIFTGELMTCIICGAQQPSHPAIESQWRALEVDDDTYYACPDEFPPDGACANDFSTAYQLVITKILIERSKAAGIGRKKLLPLERKFEDLGRQWKIRLACLRANK